MLLVVANFVIYIEEGSYEFVCWGHSVRSSPVLLFVGLLVVLLK